MSKMERGEEILNNQNKVVENKNILKNSEKMQKNLKKPEKNDKNELILEEINVSPHEINTNLHNKNNLSFNKNAEKIEVNCAKNTEKNNEKLFKNQEKLSNNCAEKENSKIEIAENNEKNKESDGVKFKLEQEDVLNAKNVNIIVSASAGSGKTTVMIEKIIRLIINDNLDIGRLLVLTYTKSAAQEMKQKLIQSMIKNSYKNPSLITQIDDVSVADISTIHSFLQGLLKKYFSFINLNPSFTILEEVQQTTLQKQAFENAMDIFGKNKEAEMHQLLDIYGKSRTDSLVFRLVKKIDNFLVSSGDPDDWCENIALKLYDVNLDENKAVKYLQEHIKSFCDYAKGYLMRVQAECAVKGAEKYVAYCNNLLSQLELLKFNSGEDYFANLKLLKEFKKGTLRRDKEFLDVYPKINFIKEAITDFLNHVPHFEREDVLDSVSIVKTVAKNLIDLTQIFREEYQQIKKQKNALDFNDLERLTLKLFENKAICDEIRERYDAIFVDEYQDANRVQEKILSSISKKNNRFMVGDVKQSIYSFRQAEPDIFLEKEEEYKNDSLSTSKKLNFNFRSDGKILNFVNIVFNRIMTKTNAKVDYLNTSNMKTDLEFLHDNENPFPVVEVDVIHLNKAESEKNLADVYSVKNAQTYSNEIKKVQLEAAVVARKILDLIGKRVYSPGEKCFKTLSFKDITILLSSRGSYLDKFCSVLKQYNIPIYANTKGALYEDSEVQVLINLLKLCRNEYDDVALASCLKSVFGGMSYDELAQIRLNNPDKKYFYECVLNSMDNPKIAAFYELLAQLRAGASFDGVYYTLNKLLSRFDYKTIVSRRAGGGETLARVDKFLHDFLNNGYNYDYVGFLNFALENMGEVKAPSFVTGENCVNITTMHSSKGLEYPVVFVVNSSANFYGNDKDTEILINKELGVGLKYYNVVTRSQKSSVMHETIKLHNKKADFADKLRLLYVALTRPKNHLFIVGCAKSDNVFRPLQSEYEIFLQNNYLSLIIGAMSGAQIEKINNLEDFETDGFSVRNFQENLMEVDAEIKLGEKSVKNSQKYSEKFANYFDFTYPYQTGISLKNSVTSIANSFENEFGSINFAPEKFALSEHNPVSPVEVGIQYHAALEKIDFNSVKNVDDVRKFLAENMKDCEINLDANLIFNCINLLQKYCNNKDVKLLKEQQFVLKLPHNQIVDGGSSECILVQGVLDLLIISGDDVILVDYKYSNSNSEEYLKKKYLPQLKLYKIASEKALNRPVSKVFLMLLKQQKLISVDF